MRAPISRRSGPLELAIRASSPRAEAADALDGLGQRQRNHAATRRARALMKGLAQGLALQHPCGGLRGRCEERRRTEEGREHGSPHGAHPTGAPRSSLAFAALQPEIDIGPLELKTFGICFAFGFLASGLLISRRLAELGRPADWSYEMVFAALVGGLVGSRVDYLIQNWDDVSDDLLGNIFSGAGLVWFGGFVGGALGVILWARWRRWLGWELFDTAAVPLAVGYAIGRVGCQLSGDGDYGTQSDLPWAMAYPDGTVPTTDEVHPTPVYETLALGVAGLVLWRLRDRVAPGVLFGLYLVIAGVERFLVEFIRRNDDVVVGLTQPQLIALGMLALGAGILATRRAAARPATV